MNIAITGASGYIGRHAANAAAADGHHVLGLCHPDTSNLEQNSQISMNAFDVLNANQNEVNAMFAKQDACLHLAWQAGFNHQDPSHIDNVLKHYYFIEKLIHAGIKNISVAGTMHEIGYYVGEITAQTPCNPSNPYGIAKNFLRQALSSLCAKHDVNLKWLRMYYITGDDENSNSIFSKILTAEARGDETFPLNSGEMLFDFIHINDLAIQLAKASVQTKYTGIINCSSGKPISLRNAVESFIQQHGLKIRPEYNVFPRREYDSFAIWGNATDINHITASKSVE